MLSQIEHTSTKGKKKWTNATRKQQHAYIESVLPRSDLNGKLFSDNLGRRLST